MSAANEKLKELRKAAGLSQEALADAAGTTAAQISRLENGQREITFGRADTWAERLARVLDVDPHTLAPAAQSRTVPVSVAVGAAFADGTPDLDALGRVQLPPMAPPPEDCFACLIADNSADMMYPAGSILICRHVAENEILKPGAKIVAAIFADSAADGDVMETLAGLLDSSAGGDVTLQVRSTNRNLPAAMRLRTTAAVNGMSERVWQPARADDIPAATRPGDQGKILGRIIWAMTPE